jgi:hypothetical protein
MSMRNLLDNGAVVGLAAVALFAGLSIAQERGLLPGSRCQPGSRCRRGSGAKGRYKVDVVCLNPSCKNFKSGKPFNTVSGLTKKDQDIFLDNWPSSADMDTDTCPKCGELGEAHPA